MFGFIFAIVVRVRAILRWLMPTNLVLNAIHTRRGLKWGVPAMLLAVPYCLAAAYCARLVERGAAGWLNLLVVLFVWNALKFLVAGPVTVIQLLRVRAREARARRRPAAGMPETRAVAEYTDELESASAGNGRAGQNGGRSTRPVGPLADNTSPIPDKAKDLAWTPSPMTDAIHILGRSLLSRRQAFTARRR